MSTKQILHQAMLNEWASRIADQKASGLTVAEWCRLNEVSRDSYFYWKRKLKDELITQALPEIVPLALPDVSAPKCSSVVPTTSKDSRTSCTSIRKSISGSSLPTVTFPWTTITPYPKELLIRTFSREAPQIADFPEKCAHNAFILTRIVLPVPHHYPTGAVPLQHQVPPPCRQSSAREAFLLTGWHTIYGWFLHRHVQG